MTTALEPTPHIDDMARELYARMVPDFGLYPSGLLLKKYGSIPEPRLKEVFQRTQEVSAHHERMPVVYINFDEDLLWLLMDKTTLQPVADETSFYRMLVGRVLAAVEQTTWGDRSLVRQLREWYETDFTRIYDPACVGSKREHAVYLAEWAKVYSPAEEQPLPLFDGDKVWGYNLKSLFEFLGTTASSGYHPLIDITFVPPLPRGAVQEIVQPRRTDVVQPSDVELVKKVSALTHVLYRAWTSTNDISRSVAYPAWTTDVLQRDAPKNQRWNRLGIDEDMLTYELTLWGPVVTC